MPATSITLAMTTAMSSALQDRANGLTKQVCQRLPIVAWLMKKGQYKPHYGPRIEFPVEYKTDDSEHSYQGMETRVLVENDAVTMVPVNWKYYDAPIVVPESLIKVENTGKTTFKALTQKQDNALLSVRKQLNRDLYLDGSGNNSKRVTGLAAAIPQTNTSGTYLGINRATAGNEWWRSQVKDSNAASYTAATTATTIYDDARYLRTICGRLDVGNSRYPDAAFCTENYLHYMDNVILKTGNRFVNQPMRDMGYKTVEFFGVTLIEDQACPTDDAGTGDEQAYYINSEFVELAYAPAMNFSQTDLQLAPNQHGLSAFIEWAGELAVTLPSVCGLHCGIKAPA